METPFKSWIKSLSKGDLVGVCYNNWFDVVLFDSFRQGDRMHFYHLCWSNANQDTVDWKVAHIQKSKPHKSYINTDAENRVFPVSVELLTKNQKKIYNALKETLHGY